MLVVWATDSAAYVAGSVVGGPKLAPEISPSKTWAGAVAGLAAGTAATIAFCQAVASPADPNFVIAGAALSLLTQCGDLAESSLKRTFGVKDASDLIPGHGGALDRLDGMIFAVLGLAAYVLWAGVSPLTWVLA
jgi:phosphatidate cytidylyltransferase